MGRQLSLVDLQVHCRKYEIKLAINLQLKKFKIIIEKEANIGTRLFFYCIHFSAVSLKILSEPKHSSITRVLSDNNIVDHVIVLFRSGHVR